MYRVRSLVLSLALAILAGQPQAQEATPSAIEAVIRDQISDFESGDLSGAFEHASPMIRQMFRTPDIFGQMVREGYPMVWRPEALSFGALESQGPRMLQRVVIRDAQGRVHFLEYEMIQLGDGWKINGVRFLEPPQVGA
ncbi:DUF4864 domain-containing protein [Tropicimonas sediminicola]|uniref:DUF4864 domain-containing protein n=1 Tax=Tropicimonas sediminicola TaxID=1031541 RepID=A0A239HX31_9RHOB|nr:DUF4864 domain-containing protein [Tropicimonas sediminicola]SNS85618.1 protein of unknown function [Tropicimonas sediminicola]